MYEAAPSLAFQPRDGRECVYGKRKRERERESGAAAMYQHAERELEGGSIWVIELGCESLGELGRCPIYTYSI